MQKSERKRPLLVSIILIIFLSTFPAYSAEILGVYLAPDKNADKPIIQLYDNAEKYIHLAIYSLTKDEFAEALVRAHKRGVEVKVLIDRVQAAGRYSDDEALERAGVQLRRSKGSGLMHNKFAIIDGIIIYTGSYNHTSNATLRNDENYIIIKDKDIAETYEKQFQKIWEKHK
jgi:phosphatidylserine/phosphatidylglycerophosphate/cardiolipin synthase-like enzyme